MNPSDVVHMTRAELRVVAATLREAMALRGALRTAGLTERRRGFLTPEWAWSDVLAMVETALDERTQVPTPPERPVSEEGVS